MSTQRPPWRGLWNPRDAARRSYLVLLRVVVYLVLPLLLALVFDEVHQPLAFGRAYAGAFIVGGCVCGALELLYGLVWPAIVHRRIGWPARIGGHVATVVVAVAAGASVAARLGTALFGWRQALPRLCVQCFTIATVVITLLIIVDEMAARSRELEGRDSELRVAALRAELSALQARTDPHFLFNSLNTLAAVIPEDPVLAESLTERLAAVFRYALDAGRRDSVSLGDEIDAVTAYLEVEALQGPIYRLAVRMLGHPHP